MGKSNRIKRAKDNERIMSLNDYSKAKKKNGMPNWAINLISIVVALAILVPIALIGISNSGIIMRTRTAMASDNYRVSGNMMRYYFNTTYQNFATNYESYMSYLSLDTSKPLKDQIIGDTSVNANAIDTSLVGAEYEGKTWYDYFMEQTQNEVRNMLYYCEKANELGISLNDDDKATIDTTIDGIRSQATSLNYTFNAYLTVAFGKGISERDVRKAMELSSLSSKAMTEVTNMLNDAITAERIDAKYAENSKNFDLVDYTYYTFRVNYSDIESDVKKDKSDATEAEILEAYKTAIADTKAKAEELLAKTTADEFEKYYLTYVANDEYDDEFDTASEGITEGKPTDENLATIQSKMVAELVEAVMADKTESGEASVKSEDGKYTVYDIEVSEAWAKAFDTAKVALFDTLVSSQTTYTKDGATSTAEDDFSEWAFSADRKKNETHKIYTGDGSEEGKEITASGDKYFYASVYLLRKPQYVNAEKSRNVADMLFSSTTDAQAAIDALVAEGSVTLEAFERIADEKGADAHTTFENYLKGNMGSDKFDKWLFDAATVVGSYTTSYITLEDGTYGVFFYTADGEEAWRVNVRTALLEEDYTASFTELETAYKDAIKVNDKVCAKLAD